MELRHLVYFDAVVRHGGFTRAAEALHVAQPSVSGQIRQLEKSVGVELLVRTTRRVRLTAAGQQFLHRARRVIDELDAARHEMSAHATVLTGHLRIGATPVVGTLPLPGLLARYRRSYPGVAVELRTALVGDLLEGLAAAELDLVIGPEHAPDSRFLSRPVARERFVLITGPDEERVFSSMRQVAGEPFVCLPLGSGLDQLLARAAERNGFTPDIQFRTQTPQSIRELVSAGIGVALVAESTATGPGHPVNIHPLRDAPDHPHISVFRAKERADPAARGLYDLLTGAATMAPRSR